MKNHHGIEANVPMLHMVGIVPACIVQLAKDKFDQVWIENKFDSLQNGFALFTRDYIFS
jgi:hypothetical protein